MLYINAKPGDKLNLGRKGENLARTILFDISQWRKLYGDGVVALLHQRAGDANPYPCNIETDGNTVAWAITASDTAVASQYGKYELQYRVNDQLAKSATGAASVYESLGESTAEPPEAQQGWVDKVLQAGAEAEAAANRAEEAAIRQPYPNEETGTWWLWDAEKGEYVDSGVPSGGEGSGGTTDHDKLRNRDAADQHPMSAITGLEKALEEKQPKGSYLTTDSLNGAVNAALAQAKESGEFDGDDYILTDADKREIAEQAAELVEIPEGGEPGDFIPVPPTAEVGQTIIVKAVDANGKPVEWEAADMASGGEEWRYIGKLTNGDEDVFKMEMTIDADGKPFSLKKALVQVKLMPNTSEANTWVRLGVKYNVPNMLNLEDGTIESSPSYMRHLVELEIADRRVFAPLVYRSAAHSMLDYLKQSSDYRGYFNNECETIDSIIVYSAKAGVGAGTELEVWGIDA